MTKLSYEEIFSEYHDKVFAYVNARIRNYHESEDITSDVFLKVVSSIDSFDSTKAKFSTWIYTIANNTMRDYLRRTSIRSRHSCDVDEDYLNNLLAEPDISDESLYREDMLDALSFALEQLPERARTIVVLHYYDGLPHKEIAQKLNLSYANVRFINHKAIETIREVFRQKELI